MVVLAALCLVGVGYFTYDRLVIRANLSVWSFVPENSLMVYENENIPQTFDQINSVNTWKTLNVIREIQGIEDRTNRLDSALNEDGIFSDLLSDVPSLISIHQIAKNEFDFLFIIEIKSINQQNILNKLQEAYIVGGFNKKVRNYLNFNITDLTNTQGKQFTYIFHRNFFIGSATAYLVEDAIRTLNDNETLSFVEKNELLFQLTKLEKDHGNIFLNGRSLDKFIQAYTPSVDMPPIMVNGYLDLLFNQNSIQMDGFVFSEDAHFLEQLTEIEGKPFDLSEIISNNTAVLYHYSFHDPEKMASNLLAYNEDPGTINAKRSLLEKYDFDTDHTFNLLDEEIALGVQYQGSDVFKSLYLEVINAQDALEFFNSVVERQLRKSGESPFTENFEGFTISRLNTPEFPLTILGKHASGFEEIYFTSFRNFLIFSNSLQNLKENLSDILNENTWLKSLRMARFLEKTNQETCFSFFISTPALWPTVQSKLDPKWEKLASINDFVFESFENIAIQVNHVEDKFFTNIVIDLPESNVSGGLSASQSKSLNFPNPIISKPFLVRNHNDGLFETIVQDSSKSIYLVDKDFNVLWSLDIEEELQGNIRQMDYYQNNKLSYAFITGTKIHVIDRNGEYLPGFPIHLDSEAEFQHFDVVDYDGSRNYRFVLADNAGNVFITDKNGSSLEGWNPRKFEGSLNVVPKHYRIDGTDIILIQLEKGEIHSLSRRSREYPGFPIDLDQEIHSDFNVKPGGKFNSSLLTTVSENGELISFNLKGRTMSRDQLLKPSTQTHFEIINETGGKDFLILRKTKNQYEILDRLGAVLFEKDYLEEEEFFIQYYDLSASKKYVVVGNRSNQFIYLYDLNGRLVTNRPIRGSNPVSMIYSGSKDEHQLYVAQGNELVLYNIN